MLKYVRTFYSKENGLKYGGVLIYRNRILGFVLEPDRLISEEAQKRFRIPSGTYNLSLYTMRNGRCRPRLDNTKVPKERCILIHEGNTERHSAGCLLLGRYADLAGEAGAFVEVDSRGLDISGADEFLYISSIRECRALCEDVSALVSEGCATMEVCNG